MSTSAITAEEELGRRYGRVWAQAHRLLELEAEPDARPDPGRLHTLIGEVTAALDRAGAGAAEALTEEHAAALSRLRQRFETRFEALERVQTAVAELREVTSPSGMLARAPAALCEHSGFERAILSLVRGGRMVAEAAHFSGDSSAAQAAIEQLQAAPPRLEHPLIETELLRRRRATIVLDADVSPRVDRRLVALIASSAYVAAPIVAASQVIGVLHASRRREQPLDVLDRDLLWEFSSGVAQAYESASLRRTLRRERDQMRQLLEWLGARSGELTDAHVTLERRARSPLTPPESLREALPPAGRDEHTVFEGLLTKRELEVLQLLAEGSSNKAIADALVISGGTVKFHVNSILRKLHAANRAEAVSRYLRLLGMRTP